MVDPLLGCELIRIGFEVNTVRIEFDRYAIEVGVPFLVAVAGRSEIFIDPHEKQGEVQILWRLIGQKIVDVIWDEANRSSEQICITLTDGTRVTVPPGAFPRGTICGKRQRSDGAFEIEDF